MQTWSSLNAEQRQQLLSRPAMADSAALSQGVSAIIQQVREQGDAALLSLTARFDGIQLADLTLPASAM